MGTAAPATVPASAAAIPFRGRGAAGGFWALTLLLLAGAAVCLGIGAAILLQMILDPFEPPPEEAGIEHEGDGRSWGLLATNVLAMLFGMGAFVAWMAALAVAGLGFGRLARPVLALSGAVAAAGAVGGVLLLAQPRVPWWTAVVLLLAAAGLAGTVAAWRRSAPGPKA